MASLSISKAWDETAEYLKKQGGVLYTVALAMIALPGVALQALGPGQVPPGGAPAPGLWLILLPIVAALSIAGTLAISSLAQGCETVVGSAISRGFRRTLPMFGAGLIILAGMCAILTPLVMLAGLGVEDLLRPSEEAARKLLLVMTVFTLIAIPFSARLLVTTPVAAAEPAGPIAIIGRSWSLTRGHFWKLVGLIVLLLILVLIIMLVVAILFGLVITILVGRPEPGSLAAFLALLVGGLVNAALTTVFTAFVARIYVQLAAGGKIGS